MPIHLFCHLPSIHSYFYHYFHINSHFLPSLPSLLSTSLPYLSISIPFFTCSHLLPSLAPSPFHSYPLSYYFATFPINSVPLFNLSPTPSLQYLPYLSVSIHLSTCYLPYHLHLCILLPLFLYVQTLPLLSHLFLPPSPTPLLPVPLLSVCSYKLLHLLPPLSPLPLHSPPFSFYFTTSLFLPRPVNSFSYPPSHPVPPMPTSPPLSIAPVKLIMLNR